MEKIYFTIAGTKHHYGQEYFEPKMEVKLVKEPDNEFDKEAIKVEMDGLGLVGYVANSPCSHNLASKSRVKCLRFASASNPKWSKTLAFPICIMRLDSYGVTTLEYFALTK